MTNEISELWGMVKGLVDLCTAMQTRLDHVESEVRELRRLEAEADAAIIAAIGPTTISGQ